MKTKRILALILAVLTLCTLTACNKKPETNVENNTDIQVTDTETIDNLEVENETYELKDFSKFSEKELTRWYPEYTDHLIPSEQYGELVPFASEIKALETFYEGEYLDNPLYGLCTADGKIVVDAVYTEIEYYIGCYILKTPLKVYEDHTVHNCCVVTSDGSKIIGEGEDLYCYDNKIRTCDGEVVFELKSENDNEVNEESLILTKQNEENTYDQYLTNIEGKVIAGPFDSLEVLSKGVYVYKDIETELEGIIDINGKVIVEAEYDNIEAGFDFFMFAKDTKVITKDKNYNVIAEFDVGDISDETDAWYFISLYGEALIEVVEVNTHKTVQYDKHGNKFDYIVYCDNFGEDSTGYYNYWENGQTIIWDRKFNERYRFDGEYAIFGFSESKNKLILGNYQISSNYAIYDVTLDKFVEEDVEININLSKTFYFKNDENGKRCAYFLDNGQKYKEVESSIWETDLADGRMYVYENNGYMYTINDNLETVFKTKIDK